MTMVLLSTTGIASADSYGFQVGIGYRQDSIRWNMKESSQINPRVQSKLHFDDLEILLLGVKFKGLVSQSLYARCGFDYGFVCDGKLRESITVERRESVNRFARNGMAIDGDYDNVITHNRKHGNNYVWDLNLALGMPFNCLCSEFSIAPMVGFSYNRQQLKFHNHDKAVVNMTEYHAEIVHGKFVDGYHPAGSFSTGWWGPMVGVDLSYVSENGWSAFAECEVHFGRLKRERRSYIDVDFIDFYKRTKDFWGTSWKAGFNYVVCEDLYVEASISYANWMSFYHRDHFNWSTGTARCDLGYMF